MYNWPESFHSFSGGLSKAIKPKSDSQTSSSKALRWACSCWVYWPSEKGWDQPGLSKAEQCQSVLGEGNPHVGQYLLSPFCKKDLWVLSYPAVHTSPPAPATSWWGPWAAAEACRTPHMDRKPIASFQRTFGVQHVTPGVCAEQSSQPCETASQTACAPAAISEHIAND